MIPTDAVIPVLNGKIVYLAKNGKAMATPVETNDRDASEIEIIKGVQLGDTIIVSGLLALSNWQTYPGYFYQKPTLKNLLMSISSVSITRPVLSTVISIVILLFGVIGYFYLGLREFSYCRPTCNQCIHELCRSKCSGGRIADN